MKCPPAFALPLLAVSGLMTLGEGTGFSQDAGAPPASLLDRAEVRIPYAELKKLWEEAQASKTVVPPEPLPEGLLLAALFRVDLSSGKVGVEAEFKVESFTGKWERLRLMGAGLAVASVDPPDARLIVVDDDLCYVAREAGPATIKVKFAETPLPAVGRAPFVSVSTAASAVAAIEVKGVPADRAVLLSNGSPAQGQVHEGILKLSLPAKGGPMSLSLEDAAMVPKEEPPPPPPAPIQPSDWALQNEVLVTEAEGELAYQARINASALNGSALEAVLLLPPNARSVKATGEDLLESRSARTAEGQTELRLKWKTRDIMERQVTVTYALQQMPLAPEWVLRAPLLAKGDQVKTLFMFELSPGVEFSGTSIQGPIPTHKLPGWVAGATKAPEFGTVQTGNTITLQSKVLPRMDTAVGVITASDYTTKLVSDGSLLTSGTVEIEHDEALRWTFTLPEKSALLKCAVDSTPVRPIARENGVLEVPLPYAGSSGRTVKSKITFSYTETREKLHAVEGQMQLELPLTPLFIQEVLWTVEIPETYQVTGVGEGIEYALATTSATDTSNIRLVRKLYRNERPQAQLFYQKKGLEP